MGRLCRCESGDWGAVVAEAVAPGVPEGASEPEFVAEDRCASHHRGDRASAAGRLTLSDIPAPAAENDVIVRVHAAGFTRGAGLAGHMDRPP